MRYKNNILDKLNQVDALVNRLAVQLNRNMSKEESMVLNWVFEFQEANHFENTTDELLMHIHNKTREQIAKEIEAEKCECLCGMDHCFDNAIMVAAAIARGQK